MFENIPFEWAINNGLAALAILLIWKIDRRLFKIETLFEKRLKL